MFPLSGIKVLELEGLAPTLHTGMMLADFGADVILVSRPGYQNERVVPLEKNYMHRGKKSIVLDLKLSTDRKILAELIRKVDVLIDPFRPGVLEKLGFTPEEISKLNPRLILARLTGYGQTGPMALVAGHDINYISYSGALSLFGPAEGTPTFPVNILGDFAAGGLLCFTGILLALIERNHTKRGQVVDNSMTDGVMYLLPFIHLATRYKKFSLLRGKNLLDGGYPHFNVYRTKDNKFVSIGPLEPKFLSEFLTLFYHENPQRKDSVMASLMDKNEIPNLKKEFAEKFATKTRDEWMAIFGTKDTCVSPVLQLDELPFVNLHQERGNIIRREGSNLDYEILPSPKLHQWKQINNEIAHKKIPKEGENTDEILATFNINKSLIEQRKETKGASPKPKL